MATPTRAAFTRMPKSTGEGSAGSSRTRLRWPARDGVAVYAGLGVLAIVVFIPAFFAAFLWDDVIIVDLPKQVGGFADIWLNPSLIESEGHYWPVVYTMFWVEYLLWGVDPVGYHVVNVVLHAANTMLIYALLRRLTVPGAWVAAALFAVHPVHVDSIAWAIERKDVLSALFYLASVLVYIRWDEHRREAAARVRRRTSPKNRRRSRRSAALYAASLALFTLALLSKSIVVTLPVMLLVYHWWRTGRLTGRDAIGTVPFFAVAIGITLGDLAYYRPRARPLDFSLTERAQIVSRSFWHYAEKLLWPSDLLPIYPRWTIDGGDPLGWGLLLAGIAVVAALWVLRDRIGRGPLAGFVFFGVTLAPALGVIDHGYMETTYVADRFQYLAGIGLIALVAGTLAHVAAKYEVGQRLSPTRILAGLCIPVLVVLGVITWRSALNYETPERFFTYIVTNNPSARGGAYLNLGNAYREQGRVEEAIEAYEQSLENDKPDTHMGLYNLGLAYDELDDLETAESYFRQALDQRASHTPSLGNLANVLYDKGEHSAAEELLQEGLRREPDDSQLLNNLATLYGKQGDLELATEFFQKGLDEHPKDENLLANFGLLLHNNGRWVEAEPILRRALDANPDREGIAQMLATVLMTLGRADEASELADQGHVESLSPAIANAEVERGNALLKAKQFTEAVEAYLAAIAADPDSVAAYVQLGVAYENLDRAGEALASYRQAYEIDDENISAVYFLGLLSARLGEFEEALVLFDEAEVLFDAGLVPVVATDADLPELVDVHLGRGFVLAQLGRLDEALADIDRALELDPAHELAASNREQILGMIGQRDEQGR